MATDETYDLAPAAAPIVRPDDPEATLSSRIEGTAGMPEPKCPYCGYIVIGLESGVCPECGKRVNWRVVLDQPEYRRLVRAARWDIAFFWLGVALNVGPLVRLWWITRSAAVFFLFATPYFLTAGIWIGYRLICGDEVRWSLMWTGSIATAMVILQWFL